MPRVGINSLSSYNVTILLLASVNQCNVCSPIHLGGSFLFPARVIMGHRSGTESIVKNYYASTRNHTRYSKVNKLDSQDYQQKGETRAFERQVGF